ncbi:MAG: YggS family pyridoxal phosphate-dependent enzyme [Sphingobacteriales bacterium]|nr:YggS family pyridoxal phosphate-dependent enzyme [Sphingobacteriales bacterium]MBI3718439.1 YggS family pyridoxal phosphate-dependent enzyme [Sphingobacteriales bacterium]
MAINTEKYQEIINELKGKATLVAVSKTKPVEDIKTLCDLGQRDFGENYVQELVDKQPLLPNDVRWHFIGHLQSNKVKFIAPFVHLIHGVDSLKLLQEINKQAAKNNRVIDCLLQVHIAKEETKFGMDEVELNEAISQLANMPMKNVRVAGLMGMASFSEDVDLVRSEFKYLKGLFDKVTGESPAIGQRPTINSSLSTANCQLSTLSMGMSGDYKIAIEEGSNMVRIGSLIFGERNYNK